jgi:F0F1-type ATP synthase assembly protein I
MDKANKEEKQRLAGFNVISLVGELGFIIALPVIVLALGGRMLDKRFDSSPLWLIVGIIISLVISSILVFRKTKSIIEDAK